MIMMILIPESNSLVSPNESGREDAPQLQCKANDDDD